jgi:hypothetical protein
MSGMAAAVSSGASTDERPPAHIFQRPPGWLFILVLVPLWLWFLYACSYPGFDFFGVGFALGLLAFTTLGWLLRVATFLWARRSGFASGSMWWLAVAPLGGLLVVGMAWRDLPLRVRWELAESDFARAVREAPPATGTNEWVAFDPPGQIGSYKVVRAFRVGDAVIFYESKGSLFDEAGFAYLPSGPFDELSTGWFEAPTFSSLGDGWYTWTASW